MSTERRYDDAVCELMAKFGHPAWDEYLARSISVRQLSPQAFTSHARCDCDHQTSASGVPESRDANGSTQTGRPRMTLDCAAAGDMLKGTLGRACLLDLSPSAVQNRSSSHTDLFGGLTWSGAPFLLSDMATSGGYAQHNISGAEGDERRGSPNLDPRRRNTSCSRCAAQLDGGYAN